MVRRPLPIGLQSFRKVRAKDSYYVDKTGYALQLVNEGEYFFLSRPRRFGKSLFVDTLKALFEGRRELFEGLEIYDRWDWSVRHPVVRLDFSGVNALDPSDLDKDVREQLDILENRNRAGPGPGEPTVRGALRHLWRMLRRQAGNRSAALDDSQTLPGEGPRPSTARGRFRHLLRTLHRQTGRRVVVLVDEYDKPIVDALDEPDIAHANRNYLRSLYSVIKACDAHIRLCFITGVSKFSKVSLFSGLNNLRDITLIPKYSALCGYTESDLDEVFAAELPGLDRAQIREWYNGYSWGGQEKVYNPFDLLLLFKEREFEPWWYETGTPTFLPRMLVEREVRPSGLDGMLATKKLLGSFDIGSIGTAALLFQTGYLTLAGEVVRGGVKHFRLGYPNKEVRQSLNLSLLDVLTGDEAEREKHSAELGELLKAADFAGLESWLRARIAGIPYQWQTGNTMADYEGYYAALCYSFCVGLGLDVAAEESSSHGRSDMVVRGFGRVFVLEFKVVKRPGSGAAMAQIKERRYADKYRHGGEPLHLVAVEFSREEKNVVSVKAELA